MGACACVIGGGVVISLFPFPMFFLCILEMQNEQYRSKLKKSNERSLALVKAAMDIVVAVGLLQLAPKKVNARVTGAFGFVSSLISCYQVLTNHCYLSILLTPVMRVSTLLAS